MYWKLLLFSLLQALSFVANATQFVRLDVDRKDNHYEINVELEVNAPVDEVRAILTDYANLDRLTTSIKTSKIIAAKHDGTVRVLMRMEKCILIFCVEMQKVEDVTVDDQGRILLAMVPESSTFRSRHASWEIRGTGNKTRIIHHAKMEPEIVLPPLLGTAVMENTLRNEILESIGNLDCLARKQCEQNADDSMSNSADAVIYEM